MCLKIGKKNEPMLPDREVLRLQDDETWEALDLDELKIRLRDKYPDETFDTLHYVRDHDAEERRERALNGLISILAKSVVNDLIAREARVDVEPDAMGS
jgi:hypothetical protein